uniref:Uncharacterized protein n=1 Tax=Glossina brevipalpis TaxID=37001 RepID=A0A1A9WMG3_9MUSC
MYRDLTQHNANVDSSLGQYKQRQRAARLYTCFLAIYGLQIIKAVMIIATMMYDDNDVVSNHSFDYIGDDGNDEGNKQKSFLHQRKQKAEKKKPETHQKFKSYPIRVAKLYD